MNNAIKKVELDLGGKVISLTPKQAKTLKEALDDLFGSKVIHEHEYIPSPKPYPVEPYKPWQEPYKPFWEWLDKRPTYWFSSDITCTYDTGNELLSLKI